MTTLAKRYVSALVKTQNISSLIASGNIDHLFLSHELPMYNYRDWETDRKSPRLNSSHSGESRMPSSA